MTSPLSAFNNYGMAPPGAPLNMSNEAPKKPHLYIGNLSPRVTDQILAEIFAVAGPVVSAKIIQDRNFQHGGFNYGFVEYSEMRSAEQALNTLNGRKIFDAEIRVNWAYQGQGTREDTQHHFHVFVGDLSPEVNDEVLGKAFTQFPSVSEARVMWDMNSGKSRGYGFLSFRDKMDAEQAIATMNGEWLGSRAIRVNWANQKTQTGGSRSMGGMPGSAPPSAGGAGFGPSTPLTYEQILAQTPEYNTTVYVGNLIPYTTQADLIPLFQNYGYIVEIRMQADRGFAFVKLDTHANASMAIMSLQNSQHLVHGRPIKCSWGKDRQSESAGGLMSGPPSGLYPPSNYSYFPGFSGIPGQPGATPTSAHPDANGASPWDAAAGAALYQNGWVGYYNQDQQHQQQNASNGPQA